MCARSDRFEGKDLGRALRVFGGAEKARRANPQTHGGRRSLPEYSYIVQTSYFSHSERNGCFCFLRRACVGEAIGSKARIWTRNARPRRSRKGPQGKSADSRRQAQPAGVFLYRPPEKTVIPKGMAVFGLQLAVWLTPVPPVLSGVFPASALSRRCPAGSRGRCHRFR